METYAFIDASNIIYGTRDEGWKVDFKKLIKYLRERYNGGIPNYKQKIRRRLRTSPPHVL